MRAASCLSLTKPVLRILDPTVEDARNVKLFLGSFGKHAHCSCGNSSANEPAVTGAHNVKLKIMQRERPALR